MNNGLTTWGDKGDANSHWFFKGLDADVATSVVFYWPVAAEKYQILTLPFGVAAPSMGADYGVAYKVVGVTEENKLVLAEYADENIEAGTPFIYKGGLATNLDASMFAEFEYADGEISAIDNVKFAFEAKEANGLVGQLCGSKKVGAGYAYLQNGNAVATSAKVRTSVPTAVTSLFPIRLTRYVKMPVLLQSTSASSLSTASNRTTLLFFPPRLTFTA